MPNLIRLVLTATLALATASPVAAGAAPTPALCFGLAPTKVGTAKADVINGTWGNDVISGLGGNDTIDGKGGDDVICGGSGADLVKGGPGRDRLRGDGGADTVIGGDQGDRALGGAGTDACDAEVERTCETDPARPTRAMPGTAATSPPKPRPRPGSTSTTRCTGMSPTSTTTTTGWPARPCPESGCRLAAARKSRGRWRKGRIGLLRPPARSNRSPPTHVGYE